MRRYLPVLPDFAGAETVRRGQAGLGQFLPFGRAAERRLAVLPRLCREDELSHRQANLAMMDEGTVTVSSIA